MTFDIVFFYLCFIMCTLTFQVLQTEVYEVSVGNFDLLAIVFEGALAASAAC